MKRFVGLIVVTVLVVAGVVLWRASVAVHADDDSSLMTEAHITRIRSNCAEAQSTLSQLHASDALLRVNRGQVYESISTELMAPLNSRLASNQVGDANLVTIANAYDNELAAFRTAYQVYEESMSQVLEINCTNEPVSFYDAVADARTKRNAVYQSTQTLKTTIQDYENEFEVFAKNFQGSHS
jgi:hypothetical protein